ncbi:MAG: double-strand break repair helicase AddA [Ahrensia sp.]
MAKIQRARPDQETIETQRRAADPTVSAWVSANAGSGKTYVLATRVIRLLMAGHDPGSILCLTYTKTAAAEMKNRVFERLASWVLLDEEALRREIANLRNEAETGRVSPDDVTLARTLFAKALETPGGLKIQTIHAFCESILHRFPLEANIAGHFEMLDDRARALLLAQARNHLLTSAPDSVKPSLARLLETLGEKTFDDTLTAAINDRATFLDYMDGKDTTAKRTIWRAAYGFSPTVTGEDLLRDWLAGLALTAEDARKAHQNQIEKNNKTISPAFKFSAGLIAAFTEPRNVTVLETAISNFFNDKGGFKDKKYCIAADVLKANEGMLDRFFASQEHSEAVNDRYKLLNAIDLAVDLIGVVTVVFNRYEALKKAQGLLDFDDLINRTVAMLQRPEVAVWVRYKLDAGIDHVLVDEAQDTSPAQWELIEHVTDDFFAGESANEKDRTVFVVGDPKQSIYSFQGADPRQFTQHKQAYSQRVRDARGTFADEKLNRSFRSTADVLAAVDRVFAHPVYSDGLELDTEALQHNSLLANQPGSVEIWDSVQSKTEEPPEDWITPAQPGIDGEQIVADRIAATIKHWWDRGDVIAGTGKPIEPGDVMVLVRKRGRFVRALSMALKALEVPVAGADRLSMTQHPAVLDLMALGRFVLDPGDDLSLAELLKSPIFGWDDDQLLDLAYGREKQRLFARLVERADDNAALAPIANILHDWIKRAKTQSVFDFYAQVLTLDQARALLIGRLGAETPDVLDEFLNMAMAAQKNGVTALQVFLNLLETDEIEIKRELDQTSGQVRIMTVHGAKGLEAPIVFLVDPGSAPEGPGPSRTRYIKAAAAPDAAKTARADLLFSANKSVRPLLFAQEVEKAVAAARQEYRRLLYVGMTRAEDRLIVAGYRGSRTDKEPAEPDKKTWLGMVKHMLVETGDARPIETYDFPAWRFQISPDAASAAQTPELLPDSQKTPLPDWFVEPVPAEPPAPRPLAPSGASGLSVETAFMDTQGVAVAGPPSPSISLLERLNEGKGVTDDAGAQAAKRGIAMHRLLQVLPGVDPDKRATTAERFLVQFEPRWENAQVHAMIADVMAVLNDVIMADGRDAMVRAEVSIMGTVDVRGEMRAVSGIIDRLVTAPGEVRILDFKTNLRPPSSAAHINAVYITQMALYRALLQPLYPDCAISAYLIYTSGPHVFEVEPQRMDAAIGVISTKLDDTAA